jgi:hypothetical protein
MRARRGLFVLFVLPLLTAADAKEPPEGWKEFQPKDKSFSVWLPDKSARRIERERTMNVEGQAVKASVIQVQVKGGPTYSAAAVLLPYALSRKLAREQRFEILRDAYLAEVKGKVTEETDFKLGRAEGRDYQIETKKGQARLRVLSLGGRIYEAAVAGSKEQMQSGHVETFLGSYKLPAKVTLKSKDK